jgi:replication factor C subunit 1
MRLRSSGDRHEIRQQYLPVLWARLVKALEVCGNDKDGIAEIIDLMDSYFLTKDDWDALVELGLGPQAEESISIPSNAKSAFTRTYNQMSHPLPFMKAGGGLPQMKRAKERPDLEEAIDESDDAEVLADIAEDEEEEELYLKKDKYVSAPKKKRPGAKKIAEVKKGKRKGKDEEEDEDMEEDSEEDVKPKKGKGRGKR